MLMKQVFRFCFVVVSLAIGRPAAAEIAVVNVDSELQQQMTYGMDFERLWHFRENGKDVDLDELARVSVQECRVDYVRVAIAGGAELVEGEYNWEFYDKQLEIMRALQRARPDIQFFASPRPVHNDQEGAPFTPFPLWISVWQNPLLEDPTMPRQFLRFEWDKAADYYVRYLRFMKEQGFKITYLDIINEGTRHLRPPELAKMADRIREQMGTEMPLVIAPSAHNRPEAIKWIEEAVEIGRADFWDITACHNTSERGSLEEFMAVAKRLDRPVWNTELHKFEGPDDEAAAHSEVLFRYIRAGHSGINDWCSLGNRKKVQSMFRNLDGDLEVMRVYYIFKQLVNTSCGGHYLKSDIPDGLTSTAAFYNPQNELTTVWVLNASEKPVETAIHIAGRSGRLAEIHWWGPDNAREGSIQTEGLEGDGSTPRLLEADTLYCFTFK